MLKKAVKKKVWMFLIIGGICLIPLVFLIFHLSSAERSRDIFILMYHDIQEELEEENSWTISRDAFAAQMTALRDAGFQTVSFDDLIAFVDHGTPLPPRAIVITFDDGYYSNLEFGAPILAELGMCATIHVIGISRGRDTHIRTGLPIKRHFSFDEVRPWVEAGVIHVQHHSHDMHHIRELDSEDIFRRGALQREGESDEDYRAAFFADFNTLRTAIEENLGTEVTVYAYPFGRHSEKTEAMLRELGVRVTLSVNPGINTIRRGEPESLFLLNRINITEDIHPRELVAFLESFLPENQPGD